MISGNEIKSGHELSLFFAGGLANKNYLIKAIFGNHYSEQYIGKIWQWRISQVVKKKKINSSLLINEVCNPLSVFYNKQKYFHVPSWISSEVDISVEMSSLMNNRGLKSDLSRIRKNKLNFEITNESDQFQDFYYNMYLPYTIKVHDNRAVIQQYEHMMEEFENCELLLLKKEQEYIAGILIYYTKNKARLWRSGIKDGNFDYVVKDRAKGALYYFSIIYLKEKNAKNISLGDSRAFLNDGILQYKKKWGINISNTSEPGFMIKPLDKTDGVKSFLLNNPFIIKKKRKLNGAVFVEDYKIISMNQFKKIYKNYFLPGMNRLYVYGFRNTDCRATKEFVPSEFSDKVTLYSLEDYFK